MPSDVTTGRPPSSRAPASKVWSKAASSSAAALVVGICIAGLLVTAGISWTAWRLDRTNDHRLLQVQTKQAAAVLTSTISSIENPLQSALAIESATDGNTGQFTQFMATYTGANESFAAASLWRVTGSTVAEVASVGASPALLAPSSSGARDFVTSALHHATFVVTSISSAGKQGIGYALGDPENPRFVIYAERDIPANRQVSVESNPAFADLHFATYLGPTTSAAAVATTNVAMSQLPLSGNTARDVIPFGNTVLTLVASPAGRLGGNLGAQLPWVFLIGGIVVTAATAFIAGQLVRRRTSAEADGRTIARLYEQLGTLYGQQRSISETLQHALLPLRNPTVANLDIATRYVAGAVGVDIGGDWYSVVQLDDNHAAFVVGDVSGRGIAAAAIMARVRFTLRAYLMEGHPPDTALSLCSRQIDISTDGHMATAIVGVVDLQTRAVTLANAGHPNPLIISEGQARYVETTVGPPLGVQVTDYTATTCTMPAGSVFLAFTDGLVERRTEDLDVGMDRLAEIAASTQRPLEALISTVVATMTSDGADDDIAILAFQWNETPGGTAPPAGLVSSA